MKDFHFYMHLVFADVSPLDRFQTDEHPQTLRMHFIPKGTEQKLKLNIDLFVKIFVKN